MRIAAVVVCSGAVLCAVAPAATQAPASNCVDIGTPNPRMAYTQRHIDASGTVSQVTQHWESVTATGSRLRVVTPTGTTIQVNEHHVQDDVVWLDRTSTVAPTGRVQTSTVFRPAILSDPMLRACAGRSWTGAASTATHQGPQGTFTSPAPAVTLRIVSIREPITVPAGRFETVRYVRTSQSVDEYWKSIEHGVIVRHVGQVGGRTVVTEELAAIR